MGPVTPDDIRRIDALYEPFPAFAAWASLDADSDALRAEVARLEELRRQARPEDVKEAGDVAMRAAAVDTGALEGLYETDRGFTMSVALQSTAAEIGFAQRGPEVPKLIAAHVAAYEYVLDAVTRRHPVTETWIRELHAILTEPQATYVVLTSQGEQFQPLPKGTYKTQPNHVRLADGSFFAYAPVDEVTPEMARLVAELSSEAFAAAHPVLQAAYAHYAFVRIHPFADGNGRVARALASVFTYRAYRVPLVVFADQRADYLTALREADARQPAGVVALFRRALVDICRLVADGIEATASDPLLAVARLAARTGEGSGLRPVDAYAGAERLATELYQHVERTAAELPVLPTLRVATSMASEGIVPDSVYTTSVRGIFRVSVGVHGNVLDRSVSVFREVPVDVVRDGTRERAFVVSAGDVPRFFSADDVVPRVSAPASMRIGLLARQLVTEVLELADATAQPDA